MKTAIAAAIASAALFTIPHQVAAPGRGARPLDGASAAREAAAPAEPFGVAPVACTFTHPQYVGNCVEKVTPTGKQTTVQACRAILACLNNSRCVKTYCQSTTIRGGWTLVSPREKKLAAATPPGGYGG